MVGLAYEILLYYKFVHVDDPHVLMRDQFDLCTSLGLLGRILVAHEGLNGTVSGPSEACAAYREAVATDPRFADMAFKVDKHQGHAFHKLSVKVREEIVTLGVPLTVPVHESTGTHLSPAEFKARLNDPNVVVIDGRNDYEYDLGHFEGALRPPFETFRETPEWFGTLGVNKNAPILTYCTGGVRCEKLTSLLIDQGYSNVFQLDGGIVSYAKDPATKGEGFLGRCFVFDDRISVEIDRSPDRAIVSSCRFCDAACETYVNCANVDCNLLYFCCDACEAETERCCSPDCRESKRKRQKRGKLLPTAS